jgi:hypothetical protein
MQSGFLVFRAHEVCDNVTTLRAAAAVTEPFVADVAFNNILGLVQPTVAARMRRHLLSIREKIIVFECLLEVEFDGFASCSSTVMQ